MKSTSKSKVSKQQLKKIFKQDQDTIDAIHMDKKLSLEQTIERLQEIRDYCDDLVLLCYEDIEREKHED